MRLKKNILESVLLCTFLSSVKGFESLQLNGALSVGENIADIGGLKEAYLAYIGWQKKQRIVESRLPGLESYTPEQMFWISSAEPWCGVFRPETLKDYIQSDPHTPQEYRVIGPISDLPEFASDFGCRDGSPMNPIHKCIFW